ncbi:MAG: TlpA family protein disulfide reductase [Gammaproteobacteria bacterium]|nr:TlpA family protein disulfide reductase [Gammaproteobacteria bacterium]
MELGESVPPIIGKTLQGDLVRIQAASGSPVVLNFFWVDCKPCVKELPLLSELEREFPQVEFYAIHVEDVSHQAIEAFINQLPAAPNRIIAASPVLKEQLNITGLPYTLLLSSEGEVINTFVGYHEAEGVAPLRQALSGLQ